MHVCIFSGSSIQRNKFLHIFGFPFWWYDNLGSRPFPGFFALPCALFVCGLGAVSIAGRPSDRRGARARAVGGLWPIITSVDFNRTTRSRSVVGRPVFLCFVVVFCRPPRLSARGHDKRKPHAPGRNHSSGWATTSQAVKSTREPGLHIFPPRQKSAASL